MLILWACAIMLVVVRYPDTPIGAALKRLLVDGPARALNRLTATRLAFLGLVGAASLLAIHFARADGVMLVAQGAPEAVGWFFAFDIGTYIDVIALAALAAASGGLRVIYDRARPFIDRAWRRGLQALARWAPRLNGRQSSTRRPGARTPPSSDDEGGLGLAFA